MEQVELLSSLGVDLTRVVLSHTDKTGDAGYQSNIVRQSSILLFRCVHENRSTESGQRAEGKQQVLSSQLSAISKAASADC